jgi:hypothetical protein
MQPLNLDSQSSAKQRISARVAEFREQVERQEAKPKHGAISKVFWRSTGSFKFFALHASN